MCMLVSSFKVPSCGILWIRRNQGKLQATVIGKLTFETVGYNLDEGVLTALPKPLLLKFAVYHRFESCVHSKSTEQIPDGDIKQGCSLVNGI